MQAITATLNLLPPAVFAFSAHPVMSWLGIAVLALIILGCMMFGPSFVRYMHIRNM